MEGYRIGDYFSKKRTREEWETVEEEMEKILPENAVKLKGILKEKCREQKDEEERETMKDYILEDYGNCERLRAKIANEGSAYFYESYTTVPVGRNTYYNFVEGYECWCGKCGAETETETSSEEEDEDEE